jgi:hypothetical protein
MGLKELIDTLQGPDAFEDKTQIEVITTLKRVYELMKTIQITDTYPNDYPTQDDWDFLSGEWMAIKDGAMRILSGMLTKAEQAQESENNGR